MRFYVLVVQDGRLALQVRPEFASSGVGPQAVDLAVASRAPSSPPTPAPPPTSATSPIFDDDLDFNEELVSTA